MPSPGHAAPLAEGQHDHYDNPPVPAKPQRSKDVFPYLELPLELQVKVLRCALVSESQLKVSPRFGYPNFDLSSQLLRVSKHFHKLSRPLLYSNNVFEICAYGIWATIRFLQAIGSANRDLIYHLTVKVPRKKVLAYLNHISEVAQVFEAVSVLELRFNWSRVHPKKRKTQLVEYKPALEALAKMLQMGKYYKNLERVVSLPSSSATALSPRVKLVRENYQLKQGETIVNVSDALRRLG